MYSFSCILSFNDPKKEAFEHNMQKGENAGYTGFLLFYRQQFIPVPCKWFLFAPI